MQTIFEEMVYMVRKYGELKVNDKGAATELVSYAKKHHGFTFKSKMHGWNHIVIDADL